MRLRERARDELRNWLYPGLDLHLRNRAALTKFWKTGPRDVLDAGSGNGYFSWLAYQSGARVVAMNIVPEQADKARRFLVDFRGADPERLKFESRNLYDLGTETRRFDEIICYETLEHIRGDAEVCGHFRRLLRPGGWLHLCCPHRLHPRHQREVLDLKEQGGHVRQGYTEAEYRALLEPLGFTIDRIVGIGTPGVYRADAVLRAIRNRLGDAAALPLFPLAMPAVWLARDNPAVPFSLYCRAVVPQDANGTKD